MIGLVALTFMMALTVADVLMRYCFRAPIPGASELTELMLVIIVFFAVADTHSVKGHVAVDLVVSHLAPHTRAAIAFIVSCLSLGLFLLITFENILEAHTKWVNSETTHLLFIPVSPFFCAIALGCLILSAMLLTDAISHLTMVTKK